MKKVKTLIIRTAGTNCDMETAYAFKKAGADVESVHINSIIGKKDFWTSSRYSLSPEVLLMGMTSLAGRC